MTTTTKLLNISESKHIDTVCMSQKSVKTQSPIHNSVHSCYLNDDQDLTFNIQPSQTQQSLIKDPPMIKSKVIYLNLPQTFDNKILMNQVNQLKSPTQFRIRKLDKHY